MRILAIADKESKALWDYYQPGKLDGIDLIISCGDLNPKYLSFLATFTHAPVLYIHGNHDEKYAETSPAGCISIENKIVTYEGVRILGLGGSMRYRKGLYQYTNAEMDWRVRRMWLKLLKNDGFDILVTHAPAEGVGDGKGRTHQGFRAFKTLLGVYKPRYFLHGHVHPNYSREYKRLKTYGNTLIINGYESYIFEYETEYGAQYAKIKERERKEKAAREKQEN